MLRNKKKNKINEDYDYTEEVYQSFINTTLFSLKNALFKGIVASSQSEDEKTPPLYETQYDDLNDYIPSLIQASDELLTSTEPLDATLPSNFDLAPLRAKYHQQPTDPIKQQHLIIGLRITVLEAHFAYLETKEERNIEQKELTQKKKIKLSKGLSRLYMDLAQNGKPKLVEKVNESAQTAFNLKRKLTRTIVSEKLKNVLRTVSLHGQTEKAKPIRAHELMLELEQCRSNLASLKKKLDVSTSPAEMAKHCKALSYEYKQLANLLKRELKLLGNGYQAEVNNEAKAAEEQAVAFFEESRGLLKGDDVYYTVNLKAAEQRVTDQIKRLIDPNRSTNHTYLNKKQRIRSKYNKSKENSYLSHLIKDLLDYYKLVTRTCDPLDNSEGPLKYGEALAGLLNGFSIEELKRLNEATLSGDVLDMMKTCIYKSAEEADIHTKLGENITKDSALYAYTLIATLLRRLGDVSYELVDEKQGGDDTGVDTMSMAEYELPKERIEQFSPILKPYAKNLALDIQAKREAYLEQKAPTNQPVPKMVMNQ